MYIKFFKEKIKQFSVISLERMNKPTLKYHFKYHFKGVRKHYQQL